MLNRITELKFEPTYSLVTNKGCIIWITGLSGAGKTTLAKKVSNNLKNIGVPSILVDGDVIRNILSENNNENCYSNEARLKIAFKYARLSLLLANQGFCVITSVIGMFEELYNWNKKNLPGYYEIFLDIPQKILKQRDSKGIYKQFENGKIRNVAGLDLEIEKPAKPNLHIKDNNHLNIDTIINYVIKTMY